MNKKVLLLMFTFFLVLVSSCTMSVTTETSNSNYYQTKKESDDYSVISEDEKIIRNLKFYYDRLAVNSSDNLDCSEQKYYNVSFMSLSINDNSEEEINTAKWYPSLQEGRFDNLMVELKNEGCTKIDPIYSIYVFRAGNLVHSSINNRFILSEIFYPNDEKIWMIPVSGDRRNPLIVTIPGEYHIWLTIKDSYTNQVVGINKIHFSLQ